MSLVIPSLGIPFSLGMLYDACAEKIIPGKTLWDAKVLDSAKKVAQQPSSNFEVYSKNTLDEKTQSLNVEASLKLSLMGGLIKIGGAGKYLNDERTSERQARVTLKYSCTSRFEQLTMEQIGSIQYPKVLDNNKATHVVTGITYGTDAFFIFDRLLSESEKTKDISGNMEAVIKAIPISGSASLDIKFGDKEETDQFECKFYGDLQLPSNPSNFQEAVNVYRELPKLINGENGDNDKTIPKVIYLHPLSELDGGHLRIVRAISDDLVSLVEEIMQSFSTMTMRANDLLSNDICSKFVELESQIQNFQQLIKRFKTNFSKDLAAILPKIRGEGAEEVVLAGIIESVHASPFNAKDMDSYIKGKSKETKQLIQYLKNMHKESKIEHLLPSRDGDLGTLISDFDIKHVVCFAFNVVSDSTAYTDALEDFLATGKKYAKSTSVKEWFDNPAISAELRSKSSKFIDFVHTNSCAEGFRFAVTDTNEETGASGPAIILYTDGSGEDYELPGKPGTPSATTVDTKHVNLVWRTPVTGADSIASYKIWFQVRKEEEESTSSKLTAESSPGEVVEFRCTPTAETKYCIDDLSPGTKYEFWVQAVSDIKVFSANSEKCCGNTKEFPCPADPILKQSTLVEHGPPQVYKLPLHSISQNKADGLYKYSIGKSNQKPEKVLMVLGATGAGKSTMINGLANYIMGVKFEDTFRFKVITDEGSGGQAHSQTKNITAYTFYSTILDYNLTVIDTPGFGGIGGIARDKHIVEQIKMLFAGQNRGGIDVLHGIGLVTQASLARLTPIQKYIFDAILSNFGKDIFDNIFLLATFADADDPPVLNAARTARIPFQQCFKFNNSALFSRNDNDGSFFNSMFWKMGANSFANFLVSFSKVQTKSLTMTREVLKVRQQLETLIPGLQVQVKVGLNQMDVIQQEEVALKIHEKSIMENKNFTYHIKVQKIKKVDLPAGTNTTTCRKCNFTCHDDCPYSNDRSKANCCAMSGGYCTVCPGHCYWSDHSNVPYRIDYYTETVTKTYNAMKELHDKAESGKQRVERLLLEKQRQLRDLENEVFSLIKQVQESNERLSEIALKPNPLTESDYLELLISSEEQEQKPGWKERVKQYHIPSKEANILKKISNMEIKGYRDTEMFQMMWSSFKSSTTGN